MSTTLVPWYSCSDRHLVHLIGGIQFTVYRHRPRSTPEYHPGSDAYASDKGVFVKPTRAGVSSGWHSPSRRVWKGLKQ